MLPPGLMFLRLLCCVFPIYVSVLVILLVKLELNFTRKRNILIVLIQNVCIYHNQCQGENGIENMGYVWAD